MSTRPVRTRVAMLVVGSLIAGAVVASGGPSPARYDDQFPTNSATNVHLVFGNASSDSWVDLAGNGVTLAALTLAGSGTSRLRHHDDSVVDLPAYDESVTITDYVDPVVNFDASRVAVEHDGRIVWFSDGEPYEEVAIASRYSASSGEPPVVTEGCTGNPSINAGGGRVSFEASGCAPGELADGLYVWSEHESLAGSVRTPVWVDGDDARLDHIDEASMTGYGPPGESSLAAGGGSIAFTASPTGEAYTEGFITDTETGSPPWQIASGALTVDDEPASVRWPVVSSSGRYVVFTSDAVNLPLGPGVAELREPGAWHVYRLDLGGGGATFSASVTDRTTLVSDVPSPFPVRADISGDGTQIGFLERDEEVSPSHSAVIYFASELEPPLLPDDVTWAEYLRADMGHGITAVPNVEDEWYSDDMRRVSLSATGRSMAFMSVHPVEARYGVPGDPLNTRSGAYVLAPGHPGGIGESPTRPWAGDPVDASSGNFMDTTVDLPAPPGSSLSLARTYNSFDEHGGVFGRGWSSLFDVELRRRGQGIEVRLEHGRRAPAWGWTGYPDGGEVLRAELVQDGPTSSLEWHDGRRWDFDEDGRLVEVEHPDGEVIEIDRNGDGRPIEATSSRGGVEIFSLAFTYTSSYSWLTAGEVLSEVVTSDGRAIDVAFQEQEGPLGGAYGALHRVSKPRPVDADPWSAGWWHHELEDGRVTRIEESVDASADPLSEDVTVRLKVANEYDTTGRVVSQVSPEGSITTFGYGVPWQGYTTVVDGASGDETLYVTDVDGRHVGTVDAAQGELAKSWSWAGDLDEATDRAGATTRLLYDDERRLRVRLLPDPETGEVEEVDEEWEWDWATVGSWATRYEQWTYVSSANPADPRIATYRDVSGQVTAYTYAGDSPLPATVTTAAGTDLAATTTLTYATGAAAGSPATVTDPEGIVSTTTYDPVTGQVASVTVGGRTTTYQVVERGDTGWDGDWSTAEPTAATASIVVRPGPESAADRTTVTLANAAGRTLRVIDPLSDEPGHAPVRMVYDDTGAVRSSFDAAGNETVHDRRLVTDRVIPRDPEDVCGPAVCEPGDGWAEDPDVGRVDTTTDPDGVVTTAVHSTAGDLVEERLGQDGAPTSVTRHTYGELGRLIRTEVDAGTVGDPVTQVTTYGYDANGNLTTTTEGPTLGEVDRTTTTVYDVVGRVIEEVGPAVDEEDEGAHRVRYAYDGAGRVVARLDAAGSDAEVMSAWRYDEAGRQVESVLFLDGHADLEDPHPDLGDHPEALVTRTAYDRNGRVTVEVQGPVNTDEHEWPSSETPAQLEALDGSDGRRITRYHYDEVTGELVEVVRPDGTSEVTSYDGAGRVEEVVEVAAPPVSGPPAERLVARYVYDAVGRVVEEQRPWDPQAEPDVTTTLFTWTPTGQLATETDPHLDGMAPEDIAVREYSYTAAGQLAEVVDPLGIRVTYEHEKGQRVRRTVHDELGDPMSEQTWAWTRDGQLHSASLFHEPGDPSPPVTTYAYDDRGRPVSSVDPSGRVEATAYDAYGQVASVTWTDGPSDPTPTEVELTHDGAGRRVGVTGSLGTFGWEHDRAGRLVGATSPGDGGPVEQRWAWDLAGNRVWHRMGTGTRLAYEWDDGGRLSVVSVDVAEEPDPPVWFPLAVYGRSVFGETVSEALAPSDPVGSRTWDRDVSGRPVGYAQSVTPAGGPATVTESELVWRADGRLAVEETVGEPRWEYDYDLAGQLVGAEPSAGPDLGWSYGPGGRRASSWVGSDVWVHEWDEATGRLEAVVGPDEGVRSFGYDGAGRRVSDTVTPDGGPSSTVTSSYDDRGRLAVLERVGGSEVWERSYDLDGRLVGLGYGDGVEPVSVAFVRWDAVGGRERISEVGNDEGGFELWAGESRVAADLDGQVVWFAHDVHGSVVGSGRSYDPFGNPSSVGWWFWGFGYRDELTVDGLVHLRNRDYDPTVGVFTTPDPLDGVDGTPTVGNPYHYADNDPLNKTDPTGLRPDDTIGCRSVLGRTGFEATAEVLGALTIMTADSQGCDTAAARAWVHMSVGWKKFRDIVECSNIERAFGGCLDRLSDRLGLLFQFSMPNGRLDPKPVIRRYLEGPLGPYGDELVTDLGHPTYLHYFDVLGNAIWGAIVAHELGVSGSVLAFVTRNCPSVCGRWDAGDDVSIQAGARAGQAYGENVTLNQILLEVRRSTSDYLRLVSVPSVLNLDMGKLIRRGDVPR